MDWNLCDARHGKGGAVTTAATTQLSPRRELPDRRLSPDGELLVCADSIEASRLTRHQRDHTPRAHTHLSAASNTKTMTAAVIMLLAQENKLSFNDPVSKYVPGVPNGDHITIAELLNMRSGLYNYSDD